MTGHFTLPASSSLTALAMAAMPLYAAFAVAAEFAAEPRRLALGVFAWAVLCVPVLFLARGLLRLPWWFSDNDQPFVIQTLRQALGSLAA